MNGRPKMTPALIKEIYKERKQILQEQLSARDSDATEEDKKHWRNEIAKCDRIIDQQEERISGL